MISWPTASVGWSFPTKIGSCDLAQSYFRYEAKQVEVIILNHGEDTSFEEDLAQDVLGIIAVFSARTAVVHEKTKNCWMA